MKMKTLAAWGTKLLSVATCREMRFQITQTYRMVSIRLTSSMRLRPWWLKLTGLS
jgi:hypothetical protein